MIRLGRHLRDARDHGRGGVGSEFVVGATDQFPEPSDLYTDDPAVTAIPGSDNFAVAYGRYIPEEPYGTTRAFLRRVSPK